VLGVFVSVDLKVIIIYFLLYVGSSKYVMYAVVAFLRGGGRVSLPSLHGMTGWSAAAAVSASMHQLF